MSDVIVSQSKPKVKLGAIVTPSFDLAIWSEHHLAEAADDPDFVQSTTFPAARTGRLEATPLPNFTHPAQQMSFSERVNLLRGEAETGID